MDTGAAGLVTREAQRRHWWWALAVIGAVTVLQLVVGAVTPLDGDETYYWDWSRHLAAGYMAHPPAIAFLIRAGRFIAGDTSLGVRLFSILSNTGGMLMVTLLALRLGSATAALRAALAMAALPIVSVWLLLATPDPIMFFANAAALYAVVRAIECDAGSAPALQWWVLAGIALGLSLLSKEMAILLPFGVLVAMVSHPSLRRRLKEPGPYLACSIALAIFSPVLIWNARHDWPFQLQLVHGFAAPHDSLLFRQAQMLGSQFAVAAGILFVMLTIATARALRARGSAIRFLLAVVALTAFGLFVLSAFRQRVEANWPASAYTAAVALLATVPGNRRWNRWLVAGYAMGLLMVALAYLHMVVPVFKRQSGGDLVRRGHRWATIAQRVAELREQTHSTRRHRAWVAANTYYDASELAFYLPDHPTAFSFSFGRRNSDYQLWPQFPDLAHPGDDLIFLDLGHGSHKTPKSVQLLTPHFEVVRFADQIEPTGADPEMPVRQVWLFLGWRGSTW